MARSRLEIARAILRLSKEQLITVEELAAKIDAYPRTILRWITQGKGGVHLDGFHRPGIGWLTSETALERFQNEIQDPSRAGQPK